MNRNSIPQDPIFVVGYPRSGTTMLQGILVTQPGFYSFPETHYFCVVEKSITFDENNHVIPNCLADVFAKIVEKMSFNFPGEMIEQLYTRAEAKELSSKNIFESIVFHFLTRQGAAPDRMNSLRWIEKTPTHANFLDRIIEYYPRAQVLYIVRHPVPAIFSRKSKFPFNRETPLADLAKDWNFMQQKIASFKEKFPGRLYTVRYEDMVKNLEKEILPIAEFLHIKFDFSRLTNYKQAAAVLILPHETWKQTDKERDFADTNDTYRGKFSEEDARAVEAIVGEKMTQYGYEPYFITHKKS